MPHFFYKEKKLLISTNYKVMYTRLVYENKLQMVDLAFLPSAMQQGAELYVLVRNPYDRLLSFFKDKFRRNICAFYQKEGQVRWQDCQRLFFDLLAITPDMNDKAIQQRFYQTPYHEFIRLVVKCYQQDVHLQPQSYLLADIKLALATTIDDSNISDYPCQLVHLESRRDTTAFARRSGINMGRKVNSTQNISLVGADGDNAYGARLEIICRKKSEANKPVFQIINNLYRTDFLTLGYSMKGLSEHSKEKMPFI